MSKVGKMSIQGRMDLSQGRGKESRQKERDECRGSSF